MTENNATVFIAQKRSGDLPTSDSIRQKLQSTDVASKISGLKELIVAILGGEDSSKLLMTVIPSCITVENHELKKLLTIYWESVSKKNPDGKLKPEMILVWYVAC